MKTLLVLLLFLGPDLAKAQEIPMGKLGFPVGTYLQIEGTRVEGLKTGERTLLVDTINGKKLEAPMEIEIWNVDSLPIETRCVFFGYETGHLVGTPPALEEAAKAEGKDFTIPQVGWNFHRHFVAVSVVEPKGLALIMTDKEPPDSICDMLFQNYIVRGGKIDTSTIMAASHIIAERGRETDFWKIVLEKLRSNDERSKIGCVRILGRMLATDARARDIIRTGEITAWDASVRLPPEVVEVLIARGKKADRFCVDHYCIALARARVPEAQDFFHLILRDDTGKSYMPTARFFSAVGLAQLGNPAGFDWLIANCEDSLPTISNAWPAGVPNLNVDTCCVAALRSLTGESELKMKSQWETWWKNADRKTLPKGPVNIVDP